MSRRPDAASRETCRDAIRITLPAFSGEAILLLKATVLGFHRRGAEVRALVEKIRVDTFRTYEPLLRGESLYISAPTFIITRCFNLFERRLEEGPSRSRPRRATAGVAAKPAA